MLNGKIAARDMIAEMMSSNVVRGRSFGSFAISMHNALSSNTLQQMFGLMSGMEMPRSRNSVSRFIKAMTS